MTEKRNNFDGPRDSMRHAARSVIAPAGRLFSTRRNDHEQMVSSVQGQQVAEEAA
jgi:hypothetical protein